MSSDSLKVIIWVTNEEEARDATVQSAKKVAVSTFPGSVVVLRNPRYFEAVVEDAQAVFVDVERWPDVATAYRKAEAKVLPLKK